MPKNQESSGAHAEVNAFKHRKAGNCLHSLGHLSIVYNSNTSIRHFAIKMKW